MKYIFIIGVTILVSCSTSKKDKIGHVVITDVQTKDTLYSEELSVLNQVIEIDKLKKYPTDEVGVLTISTGLGSLATVIPIDKDGNNSYYLKIPSSFLKGVPIKNEQFISYGGNQMLNDYQDILSNVLQRQKDISLSMNGFVHDLFQFHQAYPKSGIVGYHVHEATLNNDFSEFLKYVDSKTEKEWKKLSNIKSNVFSRELQRIRDSGANIACKKHSPNKLVFQSSNSTIHPAVLEDHQKVIIFWATWCGPCKPQMKQLAELNERKYADAKVVFFAVSSEQDEKKLFEWKDENWKKFGGGYLVFFHDKEYCMANAYEITQLPTILIFDKNDQLVKKYADLADVERIVDSLLRMK